MLQIPDEMDDSPLKWLPLKATYIASQEEIQDGITSLPAAWNLFLLGDGSPTRHLRLLTGFPTTVDVIDFSDIGMSLDGAPLDVKEVRGPRRRRQVWLSNKEGVRLGYAASWWNNSCVEKFLQDKSIPIGSNISTNRTELFRDIRGVFQGNSAELEKGFGHKGPFWGRYYLFWHNGRPLTLIYEVFSPALCEYLGNC